MEHCLAAKDIGELRQLFEQAIAEQNEELKQCAIGALALLLGNAIRQRDLQLFRQVVREIGIDASTPDARWIFRTCRQDLPPELQAWLDTSIQAIMDGSCHD